MLNRTALSLTALSVVAVFAATGCEDRRNMRTVPDRQGHAYRIDGNDAPLVGGAAVPGDHEQVYTVKAGDTMKSVCRQFGLTEGQLIERNEIKADNPFRTGMNVIVPKAKPAK